tara:strand:+ start:1133 stop:2401 length:1269 start_codon:yes stop_codon:yes gene_type:complete
MAWADDFLNKGGGVSGSYAHPDIKSKSEKSGGVRSHGIEGGGACWRYPIYIDNFTDDNNMPVVKEVIHFTAVKQGGFSLQKPADDQSQAAAREAQTDNVSRGKSGGGGGGGFSIGDFFKGLGTVAAGVIKTIDTASALAAQVSGEKSEKAKPTDDQGVGPTVSSQNKGLVGGTIGFLADNLASIRSGPKNLEHCFLYMPSSITSTDGASWGAEALGAVGNLLKEGIRGQGTVDEMLKNAMGGLAADVGKVVAVGAGAYAAGAAGAIGAAAMLGGVGNGLRAAGRFTSNPYEEQLFNGIGFREFSFDFALSPASEAEGEQIWEIIRMFRQHSRPGFVGGKLREGLYTFPNEFAISFMKESGGSYIHNEHLPKIHNCVCTNVATNFAPEGFWVALTDGRPVSYNLSLSFTETVKLTQDHIKDGY